MSVLSDVTCRLKSNTPKKKESFRKLELYCCLKLYIILLCFYSHLSSYSDLHVVVILVA
jgi:hypothetical protein